MFIVTSRRKDSYINFFSTRQPINDELHKYLRRIYNHNKAIPNIYDLPIEIEFYKIVSSQFLVIIFVSLPDSIRNKSFEL